MKETKQIITSLFKDMEKNNIDELKIADIVIKRESAKIYIHELKEKVAIKKAIINQKKGLPSKRIF